MTSECDIVAAWHQNGNRWRDLLYSACSTGFLNNGIKRQRFGAAFHLNDKFPLEFSVVLQYQVVENEEEVHILRFLQFFPLLQLFQMLKPVHTLNKNRQKIDSKHCTTAWI